MRYGLKLCMLALSITITGCGISNSHPYSITDDAHKNRVQTPTQYAPDNNGGSYQVLNTNLDRTYYRDAINKTGSDLKLTLQSIVGKQKVLGYNGVWKALKDTDEDPNNPNHVILFYSGRSDSKSNNGPGPTQWNREHVWAQSHGKFGRTAGIGSDLHNLKPENVKVNSDRDDLNFDLTESNETKYPKAPDTYWDDDSWEPRDEIKGDVARIMFYMDLRYDGTNEGADKMDLELVDRMTDGPDPQFGKLTTLLRWHELDPVDEFEKKRNEIIYTYQENRNPFIDHPEWVAQIWGR